MSLRVLPVGTDRRRRQWVDVPRSLYAGDPCWVPALRSDALRSVRGTTALHRHIDVEHFLLLDGGRPAGRVAAVVHPAYNDRFGRADGFFGFLDCIDKAGGRALLEAADAWVARRGMSCLAGPYNYVSGQEMGLLTEGFDTPPAAFQTYNPSWYGDLLAGEGFQVRCTTTTFRMSRAEVVRRAAEVLPRTRATAARLGLTVRELDPRRYRAEMETVRTLFNESFAGSPEIVPYEADVFREMTAALRLLVDRRLVRFVERAGRPVGFLMLVPDVNQLLSRLDGRLRPWDLLRLPRLKRSVDEAVLLLLGVRPGLPLGGGEVLLGEALDAALVTGMTAVHTTWVHQDNRTLRALLHRCWTDRPDKSFAVYEREVTR